MNPPPPPPTLANGKDETGFEERRNYMYGKKDPLL
jgi:hypothetical protein